MSPHGAYLLAEPSFGAVTARDILPLVARFG